MFFTRSNGVIPVHFHAVDGGDEVLGSYATGNAGGTWLLLATLFDPDLQHLAYREAVPWSAIDESTWIVALDEREQYLTPDRGRIWSVTSKDPRRLSGCISPGVKVD